MNRLLFSALFLYIYGSSFAAEVDVREVEEIFPIGSELSEVLGNASQKASYSPNFASVLFKATSTRGLSGRLVYASQGDEPDTVRSEGSRVGWIGLKLLSGTVGGTMGAIGAVYFLFITGVWEFCDDNSSEDCGEYTWEEELAEGVALVGLYSTGIATGVSAWDRRDRFIYTLAGSLIGLGGGLALVNETGRFGSSLIVLPVIAATAASEWSRDRSESRRYSLGLRPAPRGLSVVAALRF